MSIAPPPKILITSLHSTASRVRITWITPVDEHGRALDILLLVKWSPFSQKRLKRRISPSCKSFTLTNLDPSTAVMFKLKAISYSRQLGPSAPAQTTTTDHAGEESVVNFYPRTYSTEEEVVTHSQSVRNDGSDEPVRDQGAAGIGKLFQTLLSIFNM